MRQPSRIGARSFRQGGGLPDGIAQQRDRRGRGHPPRGAGRTRPPARSPPGKAAAHPLRRRRSGVMFSKPGVRAHEIRGADGRAPQPAARRGRAREGRNVKLGAEGGGERRSGGERAPSRGSWRTCSTAAGRASGREGEHWGWGRAPARGPGGSRAARR